MADYAAVKKGGSGISTHHDLIIGKWCRASKSEASVASGSGTPPSKPQQVEVTFEVVVETAFGSEVRVVGGADILGAWMPEAGITLQTFPNTYPLWSLRACIPVIPGTEVVEYKFVVVLPGGSTLWEDGPNRSVHICQQTLAVVSHRTQRHFSGMTQATVETPRHPLPSLKDLTPSGVPCEDAVTFHVACDRTCPGDRLFVVGSAPGLGDWNPSQGLQLETSAASFPVWYGTKEVGPSRPVWKVVLVREDSSTLWEDVQDRVLNMPSSSAGWHVHITFNDPRLEIEGVEKASREPILESPRPRRAALREASSPQTSVGSRVPRDGEDDSSISTVASDWEEPGSGDEDCASCEGSSWKFYAGDCQLNKPGGRCEDAFFCSPHALGVADGVGQMSYFSKYGVDSAAYALGLMERAHTALCAGSEVAKIGDLPERAATAVKRAESEVTSYGASTICVLCLEGNKAGVANLGDSGFMVLRKRDGAEGESAEMEVFTKSDEQQHGWNFPYQLMRIPPALAAKVPKGRNFDTADDCQRYTVELMAGDLVLLYTDGLADNLHQHEVLEIIHRHMHGLEYPPVGTSASAEAIAQALAHKAKERSLDEQAEVPFNVGARQYGHEFQGGKADDITVVAAWVAGGEALPAQPLSLPQPPQDVQGEQAAEPSVATVTAAPPTLDYLPDLDDAPALTVSDSESDSSAPVLPCAQPPVLPEDDEVLLDMTRRATITEFGEVEDDEDEDEVLLDMTRRATITDLGEVEDDEGEDEVVAASAEAPANEDAAQEAVGVGSDADA